MVREFLIISKLPIPIKKLIDKEEIRIDAAQRLGRIKNTKRQIETAKEIAGLKSHEQSTIISFVVNNPDVPVKRCKNKVLASKNVRKELTMIVVPCTKKNFKLLTKMAKKRKISVTRFYADIVENWLDENSKLGDRL